MSFMLYIFKLFNIYVPSLDFFFELCICGVLLTVNVLHLHDLLFTFT